MGRSAAYNGQIPERKNVYVLEDEEKEKYHSLLDVSGTGIMGYVEIPVINCALPIYHGTEESVLQIAVGHYRSAVSNFSIYSDAGAEKTCKKKYGKTIENEREKL